ncbi:MAG: NUDIX domain-containing protein [Mycobacteriales bacterium]
MPLLIGVAQQLVQKALVVNDAGQLLMVQRPSPIPLRERWDLPGGPLAVGTNLEDGMRQAVLADTGLGVVPGPPVHTWEITNTRDGQLVQTVVLVRVCRLSLAPVSDPQPPALPAGWQQRVGWLSLNELRSVRLAYGVTEVLDLYLTHLANTSQPQTGACDSGEASQS